MFVEKQDALTHLTDLDLQAENARLRAELAVAQVQVAELRAAAAGEALGDAHLSLSFLDRESAQQQTQTQALEDRSAFLARVIEHVPAAVAYLDRDLVFRITNPAYDAMLQIPGDQLLDRYLFDVLPGTEPQIEPYLRGVLDSGEPFYGVDFKFVYAREGREVVTYWDLNYHPMVFDPEQGVAGILVLAFETSKRVEQARERELFRERELRDHTQRERIAALEEASIHKEQFLGILSHELRTPLNAIQGFSSILQDGIVGDMTPIQTQYLDKVLESSEVMLALIDDLLDMSRVQAGKFTISPERMAVSGIVAQAVDQVRTSAAAHGLTLTNRVPAELPSVYADPQRVRQVLANLLSNAIKYTEVGGVTIEATAAAGWLTLRVHDTGVGVAVADQVRIFETFTQTDMSTTRKRGGVGLGLSIARALVDAHGGTLRVESAGPGQGSVFSFTLPLA